MLESTGGEGCETSVGDASSVIEVVVYEYCSDDDVSGCAALVEYACVSSVCAAGVSAGGLDSDIASAGGGYGVSWSEEGASCEWCGEVSGYGAGGSGKGSCGALVCDAVVSVDAACKSDGAVECKEVAADVRCAGCSRSSDGVDGSEWSASNSDESSGMSEGSRASGDDECDGTL